MSDVSKTASKQYLREARAKKPAKVIKEDAEDTLRSHWNNEVRDGHNHVKMAIITLDKVTEGLAGAKDTKVGFKDPKFLSNVRDDIVKIINELSKMSNKLKDIEKAL